MSDHETSVVLARLRLVKYLLSVADNRGKTHAEKHFVIEVCLMEIVQCMYMLGDKSFGNRDEDTKAVDARDMPF